MKLIKFQAIALLTLFIISCNKESNSENTALSNSSNTLKITSLLLEDFETGTKGSYTAADVTVGTGVWNLNDALIGTSISDAKNGLQSARVRNSGKLTSNHVVNITKCAIDNT